MRGILINPYDQTVMDHDCDGSLDAMRYVCQCDGFDSVSLSRSEKLWVDDNGFLKIGGRVWYLRPLPHPLAGIGLILGLDEMGDNRSTLLDLVDVAKHVMWSDEESTGHLQPTQEYTREDGVFVHKIGSPILRKLATKVEDA